MNKKKLVEGYLDLELNNQITDFREKYKIEYDVIHEFSNLFCEMQDKLILIGDSDKDLFIIASITQLHKLYQSVVLLLERGLKESAYIIVRTILDLNFKIIELVKNDKFLEDLLVENAYETIKSLNDIKKHKLFDLVPEEIVVNSIKEHNNFIGNRKQPNTKVVNIAEKHKLFNEYVMYRLQCGYTHHSALVISSIMKKTDKGFFIDGDLQLDDFKQSIGLLISITSIMCPILLNEYLNDVELNEKYVCVMRKFEFNFKDIIE